MGLEFTSRFNSDCGTVSTFSPPPVGTIMYWIRLSSTSGVQRCFACSDSYESRYDGQLWMDYGITGFNTQSAGVLTAGQLYHIACAYNVPTGAVTVWRDGVQVDSGTDRNSLSGGTFVLNDRPGVFQGILGALFDCRIYDRFLLSSEVETIYNALGKDGIIWGQLHRWPLAEGPEGSVPSGTGAIKDIGFGQLDITPAGSPTYTYQEYCASYVRRAV